MKTLYLDCYAGISGDMTVAALLDLGVPLEHLNEELARLQLPDNSFTLSVNRTERLGIPALMFGVTVHDHHTHRHHAGIDAMIAGSGLADGIKERARAIFRRLAEAEALVHGVTIDDVHFHEVGALDSIVDIVAVSAGLEYLRIDQVFAAPLPLGSGFVETAHGRLPVPAPATLELMRGLPVHGDCGSGERVTPTGAAIIATIATSFGGLPPILLEKTGCGAGTKNFPDCPNILRAFLGSVPVADLATNRIAVLETNIDDSVPEVLGYVMELLLEAGALDVFFTPIQMKKNRPGIMLTLLCHPDQLTPLAQMVLSETSAIGLRYYQTDRIILERRVTEQQTEFGPIRFKELFGTDGSFIRSAPEFEDCRQIARRQGIPLQNVMNRVHGKGVSGS